MDEVKKRVDVVVRVGKDFVGANLVSCHLANGSTVEMDLSEAAEKDEPEGSVVVHVSAKLLEMLVKRC